MAIWPLIVRKNMAKSGNDEARKNYWVCVLEGWPPAQLDVHGFLFNIFSETIN